MNIIKVRFRSQADFQKHFQSDLPNGGLFCPTTQELHAGDPVILELNIEGLPNKVMVRGQVISWRAALPRLRVRAGATVEFDAEEAPKRDFILGVVSGGRSEYTRRRHARLPVLIPVRWRPLSSPDLREATLSEVSIGGGLLRAHEPLDLGTEVIIELTSPGGSVPIALAGKVTYIVDDEGIGVKFLYRDGGGSRRLREVIRRIKEMG